MKKVLILLLASFLFSCGKKGDSSDRTADQDSEIRYATVPCYTPIRSLDPRIANEYPASHLIRMLFDGLMRLGPNGEIEPAVAERYEISEDQKTYTFYLRSSKWTNNDPVTAYDFEYAWKKSVTPGKAQTGAFTFYVIRNVEACLEGKVDLDQVGIKALDDKTLVVELEHPTPYFLSLTCCSTYAPINKKLDQENETWSHKTKHYVSNGPFLLEEWKKSDYIKVKKNPSYWDASQVRLDGITIQVIPDVTTQYYLFEQGALDWLGEPFSQVSLDLITDRGLKDKLYHIEAMGLNWLFVNTECFPFTNKNFRKALALAINRKEITQHIFQMGEKPATGILGGGLQLQNNPYFQDGDVDQATGFLKKALEELQLSKDDLPRLVMRCRNNVESLRYMQAIQQQWNHALGIHFEIEQSDWPVHFSALSKGDYQVGEMCWYSWIYDPIYMLETFRKRVLATNMSFWEHPEYQKYLTASDFELDQEKRKEFLRSAEELLMDEFPVIPVHFARLHYLKNPRLHGVYVSQLREFDAKYAYFSSDNESEPEQVE